MTGISIGLPDFKISLRANNQITITRQRLSRKREPFFYGVENDNHSHSDIEKLKNRYYERQGFDTYYNTSTRKTVVVSPSDVSTENRDRNSPLLLDLIHRFQEAKKADGEKEKKIRRGYGATPSVKNFTAKAGQKIRESGAVIDLLCNGEPSKCRVITLTLPASGKAAYQALSDWSGYATNRILQIIRDKKDDGFYWFYCLEHQKRGALHWHICLYHSDTEVSREAGESVVRSWEGILCDIGQRCGVDLLFSKGFNRRVTRAEMQSLNQEMRKGCGAYFSKYAAKTSRARDTKQIDDVNTINARLYPPSSFWGRSHNLVALCKEHSFLYKFNGMNGSDSETLRDKAFEVLSQFDIVITHSFSFNKQIEQGNGTLTVAEGESEVFYLSPGDYARALELFRKLWGKSPSSAIPEYAKRGGYLSEYEKDIGYF